MKQITELRVMILPRFRTRQTIRRVRLLTRQGVLWLQLAVCRVAGNGLALPQVLALA